MKDTDDSLSPPNHRGLYSADAHTGPPPGEPARPDPASSTSSPVVTALRMLLGLTLLTGILYPLLMTFAARAVFPRQANGSLITRNGKAAGSTLLAQKFTNDAYFWPRPSAADYATVPSGASNKGPTAADLEAIVTDRAAAFRAAHDLAADETVPSDMLFASGSGLDPHVSPEAARLQIERVANARGFTSEQKRRLAALVEQCIEPPQLGFLGKPRVNIVLLNLALDRLK